MNKEAHYLNSIAEPYLNTAQAAMWDAVSAVEETEEVEPEEVRE